MTAQAVFKAPGEGDRRWFHGGGTHTWKVTEADTNGAFASFEDELTKGKMTPWHCHPDNDEMLYVLEGEIMLNIDGDERTLTKGATSMAPRGVPHAFTVISDTARLLVFETPGSAQRFYWEGSEPAGEGEGPTDFAKVAAVAQSTGVTQLLGPPPFGH